METNEMTFVEWLEKALDDRGWPIRELARRAGLTHVTISNVLNGIRNPGKEFCLGMARAFKIPPEEVFRRAGILPPIEGDVEEELYRRLRVYIENLSPERREEILRYVMFLYDLEHRNAEDETTDKSDKTT